MKIHIDKALALYTLRTGQVYTRKNLADALLSHMPASSRQVIIKSMAEGNAKRPDPELVWKIAKELSCDLNLLYGWDSDSLKNEKLKQIYNSL